MFVHCLQMLKKKKKNFNVNEFFHSLSTGKVANY